jgi:hypothetical protein
MGMDNASYVGAKFGLTPGVIRATYKKMFRTSVITEDDFLRLIDEAMREQKVTIKRNTVSNNQDRLYKEMQLLPFTLPRQKPPPSPPPMFEYERGANSPAKASPERPRAASVPLPSPDKLAPSPLPSLSPPPAAPDHARSREPAGTLLSGGAGADPAKRPGSAAYLRPFTPRPNETVPVGGRWKWSRIDNNVPANIRAVLLRPLAAGAGAVGAAASRPATAAGAGEDAGAQEGELLARATLALAGVTRMEAVEAVGSKWAAEEGGAARRGSPLGKGKGVAPLEAVRHGLQELGLTLHDDGEA